MEVSKRISFSMKSFAGLAASLLIPSVAITKKLSPVFLLLYICLGILFLFLLIEHVYPLVLRWMSRTQADLLAYSVLMILLALVIYVYPRIDTQGFTLLSVHVGPSDTDNGLEAAVGALLRGEYPYHEKIFSGQPISQMPGALFLAIPFHILGYSSYQNVFWILIFYLLTKRLFRDSRPALFLLGLMICLSPNFLCHVLVGVDDISNSLYVLAFMMMLIHSVKNNDKAWKRLLFSLLLGIGLSSRINFILLLPLVYFAIVRFSNAKQARKYISISFFSFLLLTVPFYLYDPQGFSPLYTLHTLRFPKFFAYGHLIIPFLGGVLSILLGWLKDNSRTSTFLINCAFVQAFLIFGAEFECLLQNEAYFYRYMWYLLHYGIFFLFFGVLGFGLRLFGSQKD